MPSHNHRENTRVRQAYELVALPDDAVVAAGEVAILVGKSVETLRRWRKKKLGPRYLNATARIDSAEYRLGDIRDWMSARMVSTAAPDVQALCQPA